MLSALLSAVFCGIVVHNNMLICAVITVNCWFRFRFSVLCFLKVFLTKAYLFLHLLVSC